jgi:hypothetical protein
MKNLRLTALISFILECRISSAAHTSSCSIDGLHIRIGVNSVGWNDSPIDCDGVQSVDRHLYAHS